jgi:hypothetical protein
MTKLANLRGASGAQKPRIGQRVPLCRDALRRLLSDMESQRHGASWQEKSETNDVHALGCGFCFGSQRRCRRLRQEEADVGMKWRRPDPASR